MCFLASLSLTFCLSVHPFICLSVSMSACLSSCPFSVHLCTRCTCCDLTVVTVVFPRLVQQLYADLVFLLSHMLELTENEASSRLQILSFVTWGRFFVDSPLAGHDVMMIPVCVWSRLKTKHGNDCFYHVGLSCHFCLWLFVFFLVAIDLQQCGITNVGARALQNVMQYNTNLVVIDIRLNQLVGKSFYPDWQFNNSSAIFH